MEIGLILGPVYPTREEMPSDRAFETHMQFAERAATSGFQGFTVNHHYVVGPEAQCMQPIPMAAVLLAKYPHMVTATAIFILPGHSPVEVAEQVATLDQIAPGKLVLGVGKGYRAREAEATGIKDEERAGRYKESLEALKLLWADGPSTFEGEHYTFHDADIGLRCTTPHGPPLMLAADRVRTVREVPQLGGDHWLPSARHSHDFLAKAVPAYKEALEEAGREFTGLPFTRDICVGDDERGAAAIMERSYERMLHMQSAWGQPGENYNVPFQQLAENRVMLGSPEQVAEELVELNREYGAEFVWVRLYTPGMDPQVALEMTTRVGEEVIPLVRRETGETQFFARTRARAA